MSKINFFEEDTSYKPKHKGKLRILISDVCRQERMVSGDINIIFCSDEYLLTMNKTYLDHDYYTDIITFNYSENQIVAGDLFLSIDRIRENSEELNIPEPRELVRVILHGILHLIGYNDQLESEIEMMRAKEDQYLALASDHKIL